MIEAHYSIGNHNDLPPIDRQGGTVYGGRTTDPSDVRIELPPRLRAEHTPDTGVVTPGKIAIGDIVYIATEAGVYAEESAAAHPAQLPATGLPVTHQTWPTTERHTPIRSDEDADTPVPMLELYQNPNTAHPY